MKKSIFTNIIILIIFAYPVYAQIDLNIFKSIKPKWIHGTFDSTVTKKDLSHLYHVKDLVKDTSIYSLFSNEINESYIDGGYLEKFNVNTGKPIWNKIWDLRTIDTVENPTNIYINDKDEVEILSFRGTRKYYGNPIEGTYVFAIRKYDNKTGSLISIERPDTSKGNVTKYFLQTQFIKNSNSSYQNIFHPLLGTIYHDFFISTKMDSNLNTVVIDSVFINSYKHQDANRLVLIDDNTFATMISSCNSYDEYSDTFYCRRYIILYDRDMNQIKSIDITDDFEDNTYYRIDVKYADDRNMVLRYAFWQSGQWQYRYKIYDYNGKLADVIDLNKYNMVIGAVTRLGEDEFLYTGIAEYIDDDQNPLYFYKKKLGGDMILLKKIEMKNKDYCIKARQIYLMPDNDILVNGTYFKISYQIGDLLSFPIKIRFSSKDIDITTSNNIEIMEESILIYPNPSSNTISISCEDNPAGSIEIIDKLGRVMYKEKSTGCEEKSIDISGFCQGLYFVRMIDDSGRLVGKGKFVKE